MARWQAAESAQAKEFFLTTRDREMLKMVAEGSENGRIAETLHLAEQTVRNRISRIYAKTGVSSRPQLVVWAREQGLGTE